MDWPQSRFTHSRDVSVNINVGLSIIFFFVRDITKFQNFKGNKMSLLVQKKKNEKITTKKCTLKHLIFLKYYYFH